MRVCWRTLKWIITWHLVLSEGRKKIVLIDQLAYTTNKVVGFFLIIIIIIKDILLNLEITELLFSM